MPTHARLSRAPGTQMTVNVLGAGICQQSASKSKLRDVLLQNQRGGRTHERGVSPPTAVCLQLH